MLKLWSEVKCAVFLRHVVYLLRPRERLRSIAISISVCLCMCVCLSVCLSVWICPEPHARSLPFFVHVAYGHGSVLLRRRCDTLCTSGFVDDFTFFYNGSNRGMNLATRTDFEGGGIVHRGRSPIFTIALSVLFPTHGVGSRRDQVFTCVCTFVCFLQDISKYDAARITKLDIEMFHDESWKNIYFVGKSVTKTLPA